MAIADLYDKLYATRNRNKLNDLYDDASSGFLAQHRVISNEIAYAMPTVGQPVEYNPLLQLQSRLREFCNSTESVA